MAAKTQELADTQTAVTRLAQQLQREKRAAETDQARAAGLALTVRAQDAEVGRLRARLRELEGRERPPAPTTLTEAARELTALGY